MKRHLLFFALLLGSFGLYGQKSMRDSSITMGHLSIVYGAFVPGGDMADRFGLTNMIGAEGGVKLKNNFYFSTGLKFVFGGLVREVIADNVLQLVGSDSLGFSVKALGADGRFYNVRFFERGFVVPLTVGKIFPLSSKHPNSGIYVELGTQFLQHKVSINAIGDNVPYLSKPYLKGYDRLTNGIGLVEGFGYRYYGNNRFTNFFIGAEFSQSFTKSRRDLNFDTGLRDDKQRTDMLFGLKAGWTFPIYRSAPDKEYYY